MKKTLIAFFILTFSFSFTQDFDYEKIDKEIEIKYKFLNKKFRKKFSDERKIEELKIGAFRREQYLTTIDKIRKSEVKSDLGSIPKAVTKPAIFEDGILEFRKLYLKNFNTSAMENLSGI